MWCVAGSDCGCAVTRWCEAADLLHAAHLMHGETRAHCTALNLDLSPLLPHSAATASPLQTIPAKEKQCNALTDSLV